MTHTEFKKRMGLGEFAPELINREGKVFNFMEYNEEEDDDEEEELSNSRLRGGVVADEAVVERKLQGPVPINPANTPTATDKDEKDWHELGLMGPIRQQVSFDNYYNLKGGDSVAAEELRPLPPAMSLLQFPNTDYLKCSYLVLT